MFEDIDDKKAGTEAPAVVVSREAGDRALLYGIWTRNAGGGLAVEDAWAVLHERYPDEARFLLLHAYEELVGSRATAWTPPEFLGKVRKVLDTAGGRLNPEVRDLLTLAEDDLHPLSEEDAGRLERLRARVSLKRNADADAARKRLQRLSSDVVRELHDRTSGGKAIGRSSGSMPVAAAAGEWKTALSGAKGARTPYSPTAKVSAGDVVEHPKFGAGVVLSVEPSRAQILFESGARKLIVA